MTGLTLPAIFKSSSIYIHERKGIAKGSLIQNLGPWKMMIAYISKRLDPVALRWPPCLRDIEATVILEKEANKLTVR